MKNYLKKTRSIVAFALAVLVTFTMTPFQTQAAAAAVTWSGVAKITEANANNGTFPVTILTANLAASADTFKGATNAIFVKGNQYTVTPTLPAGVQLVVRKVSNSKVTATLSGTTTVTTALNKNYTIAFTAKAFTKNKVVSGVSKAINFVLKAPYSVAWTVPVALKETPANNGTVMGTVVANLTGAQFAPAMVKGTQFTVTGVPSGVNVKAVRNSATRVTFTFESIAKGITPNAPVIKFTDKAFVGYGSAAKVTASQRVLAAIAFTQAGTITGTVKEGATKLAGVKVELKNLAGATIKTFPATSTTGVYTFTGVAVANGYKVVTSKVGYNNGTSALINVTAVNTNTGKDVVMTKKAAATLTSIAVKIAPTKTEYNVGDTTLDLTGLVVEGTYSDGTKKVETVTAANVTGFNATAAAASQTLTVTVNGKKATFNISVKEVAEATLASIEITAEPTKTEYTVGDTELNLTGLVVEGTYSDGTKKTEAVTAANITGFDTSVAVASQTLTVTVNGKTDTFVISVVEASTATLTSIEITAEPTKTEYVVGDTELNLTGLIVEGTYSDGTKKPEAVTAANISGFDTTVAVASQTLTVTVNGKTDTFVISVVATPTATEFNVTGKIIGSDSPTGLAAALVLKNSAGTVVGTAAAIANGSFTISNVAVGTGYSISVTMPGYTAGVISNINVVDRDVVVPDYELTKEIPPTITAISLTNTTTVVVTLDKAKSGLVAADFKAETGTSGTATTTLNTVIIANANAANTAYTLTLATPLQDTHFVKISNGTTNIDVSSQTAQYNKPVSISSVLALTSTTVAVTLSAAKAGLTAADFTAVTGTDNITFATVNSVTNAAAETGNTIYTLTLGSAVADKSYIKILAMGANLSSSSASAKYDASASAIKSVLVDNSTSVTVTLSVAKSGLSAADFTAATGTDNATFATANAVTGAVPNNSNTEYKLTLISPMTDAHYVRVSAAGANLLASQASAKYTAIKVQSAEVLTSTTVDVTLTAAMSGLTVNDFAATTGTDNAVFAGPNTVTAAVANAENTKYTLTLGTALADATYVKIAAKGLNLASGFASGKYTAPPVTIQNVKVTTTTTVSVTLSDTKPSLTSADFTVEKALKATPTVFAAVVPTNVTAGTGATYYTITIPTVADGDIIKVTAKGSKLAASTQSGTYKSTFAVGGIGTVTATRVPVTLSNPLESSLTAGDKDYFNVVLAQTMPTAASVVIPVTAAEGMTGFPSVNLTVDLAGREATGISVNGSAGSVVIDFLAPQITAASTTRTGTTTGTVTLTSHETGTYKSFVDVTGTAAAPTLEAELTGMTSSISAASNTISFSGLTSGTPAKVYMMFIDTKGTNKTSIMSYTINAAVLQTVSAAGRTVTTGSVIGTFATIGTTTNPAYVVITDEEPSQPLLGSPMPTVTGGKAVAANAPLADTTAQVGQWVSIYEAAGTTSPTSTTVGAFTKHQLVNADFYALHRPSLGASQEVKQGNQINLSTILQADYTDCKLYASKDTEFNIANAKELSYAVTAQIATLPATTAEGKYNLYLYHAGSKTVSNKSAVQFTVDNTAPILSDYVVNRTGNQTGTVTFKSSEAIVGSAASYGYYGVFSTTGYSEPVVSGLTFQGLTADANNRINLATVTAGTAGAGFSTGIASTASASFLSIYAIDKAGNKSARFDVPVAAYVVPIPSSTAANGSAGYVIVGTPAGVGAVGSAGTAGTIYVAPNGTITADGDIGDVAIYTDASSNYAVVKAMLDKLNVGDTFTYDATTNAIDKIVIKSNNTKFSKVGETYNMPAGQVITVTNGSAVDNSEVVLKIAGTVNINAASAQLELDARQGTKRDASLDVLAGGSLNIDSTAGLKTGLSSCVNVSGTLNVFDLIGYDTMAGTFYVDKTGAYTVGNTAVTGGASPLFTVAGEGELGIFMANTADDLLFNIGTKGTATAEGSVTLNKYFALGDKNTLLGSHTGNIGIRVKDSNVKFVVGANASLVVPTAAQLKLEQGATDVLGTLNVSGGTAGTLSIPSTINVAGKLILGTNAQVEKTAGVIAVSSTGTLTVVNGVTLTNLGTITNEGTIYNNDSIVVRGGRLNAGNMKASAYGTNGHIWVVDGTAGSALYLDRQVVGGELPLFTLSDTAVLQVIVGTAGANTYCTRALDNVGTGIAAENVDTKGTAGGNTLGGTVTLNKSFVVPSGFAILVKNATKLKVAADQVLTFSASSGLEMREHADIVNKTTATLTTDLVSSQSGTRTAALEYWNLDSFTAVKDFNGGTSAR